MSTELQLIRDLYRYLFRKLRSHLRATRDLPVREWYQDRGATYPSLADMYQQILDDDRFWFAKAYTGTSFQAFPLGVRLSLTTAERATRPVDRMASGFLRGLRPFGLDRSFDIREDRRSITIRAMVLQMIEGDLHHNCELDAPLGQVSADSRIVSWIDWDTRSGGSATLCLGEATEPGPRRPWAAIGSTEPRAGPGSGTRFGVALRTPDGADSGVRPTGLAAPLARGSNCCRPP